MSIFSQVKSSLGNLGKLLSGNNAVIFIAVVILLGLLYFYSNSKTGVLDKMEDGSENKEKQPSVKETSAQNVVPAPSVGAGYTAQNVANPSDLLPQDKNSEWAALNPVAMNQGNVAMPDLLTAGYHIGLDTIGQTLRNANYQLRSDPIISKADVGPWNQSTIEADLARVPLEIGVGQK
jgi:hypothetical protein